MYLLALAVDDVSTFGSSWRTWMLGVVAALVGVFASQLLEMLRESKKAKRERHNIVWKVRAEKLLKIEADAGVLKDLLLCWRPLESTRGEIAALSGTVERYAGEVWRYGRLHDALLNLSHAAHLCLAEEKHFGDKEEFDDWSDSVVQYHKDILEAIENELNT